MRRYGVLPLLWIALAMTACYHGGQWMAFTFIAPADDGWVFINK